MDDSIRKELHQLPDEEVAQVDGGAIDKDLLYAIRWVECLKCRQKFDYMGWRTSTDIPCPYCGGKLTEMMKIV